MLWYVETRLGFDLEDRIGWSLVPFAMFVGIKMRVARHLLIVLLVPDKRGPRNITASIGLALYAAAPDVFRLGSVLYITTVLLFAFLAHYLRIVGWATVRNDARHPLAHRQAATVGAPTSFLIRLSMTPDDNFAPGSAARRLTVDASKVRRIVGVASLALLGAAAYFCFWPVPVDPVSWPAPTPPGFTGAFAPNTRLSGLRMIEIGSEVGPEHIAVAPDGMLYAAMAGGNLVRMEADGGKQEVFANTGGRVLGFDFDAQGRMIAADAMKGLLAITADRRVAVVADHVTADDPIGYANAVVVAPDGTIYLTDSSRRFLPVLEGGTYEASVLDIIEQSATGRVLAHDPATGRTRIVGHGLSFANGVALSSDGHTLFVNETGRYRVWKIDGRASDLDVRSGSPQTKVLLENLPGYPDNLMRGRDGRIWVGLSSPRNPAADGLAQRPFLRKVILRLPRPLLPLGDPYGHVFAIDEDGRVTTDLQDPTGAYPETTGATETADRLYIHSLHARRIGWLPR